MGNAVITVTNIDVNRKMAQIEINWQEYIPGKGQAAMREYYTTTIANEPSLN